MGTQSMIHFIKKRGEDQIPIVNIYQQFDGYIEGVGYELASWLLGKKMINGIGFNQNTPEFANGVGCLVAQFIRDHKDRVGDFYIRDIDDSGGCYDYNYYVFVNDKLDLPNEGVPVDNLITIKVRKFDCDNIIFEGNPSELLNFKEESDDSNE